MTPAEAAHLGASILGSFLAWEETLPPGPRRMFGGDRVNLLCAALLVPPPTIRMPPSPVEAAWALARGRGEGRGRVSMSYPLGPAKYVEIDSTDLILAAAIVLAVDRLDERGRPEVVPEELRAAASIALMLGLEVRRVEAP